MGALAYLWRRLAGTLGKAHRQELDDRLDDEIRFHVEQQTEKNRRAGMTPDEARRQALVRFGGVEQMREGTRDVFRAARLEHLASDIRYGLRSLRRHPGFTVMAVLSLAIGIGANATIFAVAQAVLFHKSPFHEPATLVNIYESERGSALNPMSYPNIDDLRKGTTGVFTGIAASTFAFAQIDRAGTVDMVMGEAVSGGAFALLGIEPLLGRTIQPADDVARGGHPVVMLSHGYWQRAFGGDPRVVGRTLQIGRRVYTIIGVAPPDYRGGLPAITPAFYVPIAMQDELMGVEVLDRRDVHNFFVKARLAPGVTRVAAGHAASQVASSLTLARPEGWVSGQQFSLVPTSDVQVVPGVDPLLRAATWLLIAVVGLVLLLACTNLASFLVARALDRSQEVTLRRALGATRSALVRQMLVESVLLGLGGAAVGLVLAFLLLNLLLSIDLPLPYGMRLDLHLGLDDRALLNWRVLTLTAGTGVLAGGLLGLFPAIRGTRGELSPALSAQRGSSAPGPLIWRNALVVAQISMSLVLLVGAGLFLRSWQHVLAVDPGFGHAPTAIVATMVPMTKASVDAAQRTRSLRERFRAEPGVEAVGLVWPLPLELSSSNTNFTIDGRALPAGQQALRADRVLVDGGFFDAAGVAIVAGRNFNESDRSDSQPVAIVSQAMARRYWPEGDALGRILRRPDPAEPDLMIVGVASDINLRSLGEAPRDVVYEHFAQLDRLPAVTFIVRTSTDPARMSQALVAVGRQIDPDLRIVQATTMTQHLAMSRLPSQIGAVLLSAFASLGMALAAIGVYGMVRYTVSMRTREVGIRIALGADASGVARQLATHSLRLVLIGGALGIGVSLLVARFLTALLFGVAAFDPVALTSAPVVLGIAAWLAAYLPARRASRADPLAALRTD
jgi:putative ABC transport system permease protein